MSKSTYQVCSCGNLFVAVDLTKCSSCRSLEEGAMVFSTTIQDLDGSYEDMSEIKLWTIWADSERVNILLARDNTMSFQDFALFGYYNPLKSILTREISKRQPPGKAMAQSKYFMRFDHFLSSWLVEGWNDMLKGLIDREDPELALENFIDTMLEEA
jgi:hypothetical protein